MDEAAIERRGSAPLAPALARINAIETRADLATAFAEAGREGMRPPIFAYVDEDQKNASRYVAGVDAGGLGLPDRSYYLTDTPDAARLRSDYVQYIGRMLSLAGVDRPAVEATAVFDLEKAIAAGNWTRVESSQTEKQYNPAVPSKLGVEYPGFDWVAYLNAAGFAGRSRIIVAKPSAVRVVTELSQSTPLETWRAYLKFHTVSQMAPVLPKAFVDAQFAFEGTRLDGRPVIAERWRRGVQLVDDGLGKAVGRLYVRDHFPPEAKAAADKLVRNILAAMDARLVQNAWLSPATIVEARAELAAVHPEIGYPKKQVDYRALEIRAGDAYGNQERIAAFAYARQLARLDEAVDPGDWWMDPQTVNAYANPLRNEIVFPAAILQPPFFDPLADAAVNYGAIGAIIGHELSHLFDDHGRKFDKNGNLANWWTPNDVARFRSFTGAVVGQYGGYEPLPGRHVSGENTLNEDIADLAGVAVALQAYHLSLGGKVAPVRSGFTGDQRFFLAYAQIWREKTRPAKLDREIRRRQPRAARRPSLHRAQLTDWYDAFHVTTKDRLYLKPQDRIRIW